MTVFTLPLFFAGTVLLIAGAKWLVNGASGLAAKIGIPPLVIGLTVVAFGTSSPEMAVSVHSSLAGQSNIALGNVMGSNIINVLLILGLSSIIRPVIVQKQLIRFDVPVMIGISLALYLMALDGRIGRAEGLVLLAGSVIYTFVLIRKSRAVNGQNGGQKHGRRHTPGAATGRTVVIMHTGAVLAGLVLLVLGSRLLVDSSVAIARWLGLSDLIIGLTIVAAGTSMPEAATSVAAAVKGEIDIAVGNVVGSNIINIVGVAGLSAAVIPSGLPVSEAALGFDLPVMVVVAFAALPVFFTGYRIARWEGWVFLGYYLAYNVYLFLNAAEHDALPIFNTVVLWFAAPLTLATVGIAVFRELHRRARPPL